MAVVARHFDSRKCPVHLSGEGFRGWFGGIWKNFACCWTVCSVFLRRFVVFSAPDGQNRRFPRCRADPWGHVVHRACKDREEMNSYIVGGLAFGHLGGLQVRP